MHRLLAILASLVLLGSLAGSSLAAPAPSQVNNVVGDFDLVDWDGTFIARVHVAFREPTESRLVPGTLDLYWAEGNPVRESHAQLFTADFWSEWYGEVFSVQAFAQGYLCDYTGVGEATCHEVAVIFQNTNREDYPNLVGWGVPGDCCYDFHPAGRGNFVVTLAK